MAIEANTPGGDNSPMIYIPVAVFAVISPLLCGLRVWSRMRKGGRLGTDDYFVLTALVFALASSGIMIAGCKYGFGQHIYNLTPNNKIKALMYFYICQITYKASINFTKMSILLLYVRIFGNVRWFKWMSLFVAVCVAMYSIASITATIFQCTPVDRAFNKLIPGTCISNSMFWYANGSFSIATDLIILFIPMPLIYQLQIPRVQKVALVVVLALGGFVVITSCLRMTTINIAATSPDSTYDIASTMWTMIEMNVAIVCACLPMIRPLLVKLFPRLISKSGSSRKYGNKAGTSGFGSKGYISSRSQDGTEPNEWSGAKDNIHMANIRKGDQSSEEYILHDDKNPTQLEAGSSHAGKGIHKTIQYSVEYSKEKGDRHDWE